MFYNWLNPIFYLLALFGLSPLMLVDAEGNEIAEDEWTDETDIFPFADDPDKADLIFDREDVDIDKFNAAYLALKNKPEEERHIYFKDIKISKDKNADDLQNNEKTDLTDIKDDLSKDDANVDETKKAAAAGDKTPPEVKTSDATKKHNPNPNTAIVECPKDRDGRPIVRSMIETATTTAKLTKVTTLAARNVIFAR